MAIRKKKGGVNSDSDHEKLSIALDIGSYKLRMIAGHVTNDLQIKVKGYLECPSRGVSKGSISDIDLLASSIAYLIQEFQKKYGITVKHIITSIPGVYICAENQSGTATVQTGIVSNADRNRAIKNALAGIRHINLSEFSIIHSSPQKYKTELSDNISNPVGQYARRIEVSTHIIGCQNLYKKNIELVINKTSPDIVASSMIYDANAAAASVLTEAEKEIGVILVDIGSGSTSVTLYEGKNQLISFGVKDGGEYITRFIAKAYSISMNDAERLKLSCGYACRHLMSEDDAATNTAMRIGDGHDQLVEIEVNYGELADIIHAALLKMFEYILIQITEYARNNVDKVEIGGGFVLTGGCANLYGIDKVFQSLIPKFNENPRENFAVVYNEKVRIGHANGITVTEDCGIDLNNLRDSSRSVITGLLRSARADDREQYLTDSDDSAGEKGKLGKAIQGLKNWIKSEF